MDDSSIESMSSAYGYKLDEEVNYRGLLRAKIKRFELNNIVVVVFWSSTNNSWETQQVRVSVNDFE